jgi:hypothetical protein
MSHSRFLALEEMDIEMEEEKKEIPSSMETRNGDQTE